MACGSGLLNPSLPISQYVFQKPRPCTKEIKALIHTQQWFQSAGVVWLLLVSWFIPNRSLTLSTTSKNINKANKPLDKMTLGSHRLHYAGDWIWRRSFLSTVRPTAHTNLSQKRRFSKTLFKLEEFGKRRFFVFLWTESILKTELFESDQ